MYAVVFALLFCFIGSPWAADSLSQPTRVVWMDIHAPLGSDMGQWVISRFEESLSREPGFQLITQAQRAQMAQQVALQPETRLIHPDSVYLQTIQPDFWIELTFDPILHQEGRAGWLFMVGRRSLQSRLHFSIRSERQDMPPLQGTLQADTTWLLEYCGFLECVNKPMPAVERLPIEKSLYEHLLWQLHERIRQALTIPLREQQKKTKPSDTL